MGADGLGSVSMGRVTGLVVLRGTGGVGTSGACSVVLLVLALGFAFGERCTEELVNIKMFVKPLSTLITRESKETRLHLPPRGVAYYHI